MGNDHGTVIVGFFAKIAVTLTLFAIVCFDAVSVGVTKIGVEDTARNAARAGSEAWVQSKDVNRAFKAAADYAEDHGATISRKSFVVDRNGKVTVTVSKEATTLLLFRTKKTAEWTKVTATGSGRYI